MALPLAAQERFRLALWHTGLGRDGPGLLLQDIRRGEGDVLAVRDALVALAPDAAVLLDFDHDRDGLALEAFGRLMADGGHPMPIRLSPRPNSGLATGLDLDGDGRRGTPDDAQGWGRFAGSGGIALLSRRPLVADSLIDHSARLWRDLPGARLPRVDGQPFPGPDVWAIQRLSSTGHWEITVTTPMGDLALWTWHAGPPAFGGPHGRNRARNADETAFWLRRLNGDFGPLPEQFVLLGGANLDATAGDGDRAVMAELLAHPALQDPAPRAPPPQGGEALAATAIWPDGPGALRVDYLLPSAGLRVVDSGLIWPPGGGRHALLWVDLAF